VRDTGCTLKAMRRECREALVPFYGMHRFIPALVKGLGYQLVEVPVHHRPRTAGVSKYGFGNRAVKATMDMLPYAGCCPPAEDPCEAGARAANGSV
jgi:dolichol-phosphate mannosyltransferase